MRPLAEIEATVLNMIVLDAVSHEELVIPSSKIARSSSLQVTPLKYATRMSSPLARDWAGVSAA